METMKLKDLKQKRFPLKVTFQREKDGRKFRVPSFAAVYIFIYLQRENAVGLLSKFIAQNVRRQRLIYWNKIDKK